MNFEITEVLIENLDTYFQITGLTDENKQAQFASVGRKPFVAAQYVLSTYRKTAVQIENTACLQIGGLCWYLSEGTFEMILPLLLWLLLLPLGSGCKGCNGRAACSIACNTMLHSTAHMWAAYTTAQQV